MPGYARRVSISRPKLLPRQLLLCLPGLRQHFSLVEIQSWFLVSSGAEFEIFFPPLLVISEKKTGRFYSTVSYRTFTLINFRLVFISFFLHVYEHSAHL